MLTFRDLINGFRKLELNPSKPVIVHASLSAFGQIQGGAETLLGALLTTANSLIMPAFTYKTMLTPEVGPPNNGLIYGKSHAINRTAKIFDPGMPVDPLMGLLSEMLRGHPQSYRSLHPVLSFSGVHARRFLEAQTYAKPLAPIEIMTDERGWVLLLGVNHTVNTSIHYAEWLAGRKQFVRWALTHHGVRECPGFPGCSQGFQAIAARLEDVSRKVQVGTAMVEAVPLRQLIQVAQSWIIEEPTALLCSRAYCECCSAVREALADQGFVPAGSSIQKSEPSPK